MFNPNKTINLVNSVLKKVIPWSKKRDSSVDSSEGELLQDEEIQTPILGDFFQSSSHTIKDTKRCNYVQLTGKKFKLTADNAIGYLTCFCTNGSPETEVATATFHPGRGKELTALPPRSHYLEGNIIVGRLEMEDVQVYCFVRIPKYIQTLDETTLPMVRKSIDDIRNQAAKEMNKSLLSPLDESNYKSYAWKHSAIGSDIPLFALKEMRDDISNYDEGLSLSGLQLGDTLSGMQLGDRPLPQPPSAPQYEIPQQKDYLRILPEEKLTIDEARRVKCLKIARERWCTSIKKVEKQIEDLKEDDPNRVEKMADISQEYIRLGKQDANLKRLEEQTLSNWECQQCDTWNSTLLKTCATCQEDRYHYFGEDERDQMKQLVQSHVEKKDSKKDFEKREDKPHRRRGRKMASDEDTPEFHGDQRRERRYLRTKIEETDKGDGYILLPLMKGFESRSKALINSLSLDEFGACLLKEYMPSIIKTRIKRHNIVVLQVHGNKTEFHSSLTQIFKQIPKTAVFTKAKQWLIIRLAKALYDPEPEFVERGNSLWPSEQVVLAELVNKVGSYNLPYLKYPSEVFQMEQQDFEDRSHEPTGRDSFWNRINLTQGITAAIASHPRAMSDRAGRKDSRRLKDTSSKESDSDDSKSKDRRQASHKHRGSRHHRRRSTSSSSESDTRKYKSQQPKHFNDRDEKLIKKKISMLISLGVEVNTDLEQVIKFPLKYDLLPCRNRDAVSRLEDYMAIKNLFKLDTMLWISAIQEETMELQLTWMSENPLQSPPQYGSSIMTKQHNSTTMAALLKNSVPIFKPSTGTVTTALIKNHVITVLRFMLKNRIHHSLTQGVMTASLGSQDNLMKTVVSLAEYYSDHTSTLLGLAYFWIHSLEIKTLDKRDHSALYEEAKINGREFFYTYNFSDGLPFIQRQSKYLTSIDPTITAANRALQSESIKQQAMSYILDKTERELLRFCCDVNQIWSMAKQLFLVRSKTGTTDVVSPELMACPMPELRNYISEATKLQRDKARGLTAVSLVEGYEPQSDEETVNFVVPSRCPFCDARDLAKSDCLVGHCRNPSHYQYKELKSMTRARLRTNCRICLEDVVPSEVKERSKKVESKSKPNGQLDVLELNEGRGGRRR